MPAPDTLQTYLLAINAASFAILSLGYALRRDPQGPVAAVALCLLSAAGGPVGVLLGLLLFGRGARPDKANVSWRMAAVFFLLVWAVALGCVYGLVVPDPGAMLANLLGRDHRPLAVYLCAVSLATLALFAVDKRRSAREGAGRVPEVVLLVFSLAGGSLAGILASRLLHHKTNLARKWYFVVGLPLFLALDLAVIAYLIQLGLA